MADRRMFSKTIVDSDAFLDMPTSAQALYFHLGMKADDDGFVNNPKKIQRYIGASEDDLKLLVLKNFLIPFESGVVVIKHWKINNSIRLDRKKGTTYSEELALLTVKSNGAYTLDNKGIEQLDNQVTTKCQPSVNQVPAKCPHRIDKNSIDKNSIGKDSIDKITPSKDGRYFPNDDLLNQAFSDYVDMRKKIKAPMTERAIELAISKLDKLAGNDRNLKIDILNQSIMNSWKGLFEISDKKQKPQTNNKFNNFKPREYDFDALEKKLLGNGG